MRPCRASAAEVYDFIRSAGPVSCMEASAYLGRNVEPDIQYLKNRGMIRKVSRTSYSTGWRWMA